MERSLCLVYSLYLSDLDQVLVLAYCVVCLRNVYSILHSEVNIHVVQTIQKLHICINVFQYSN